MLSTCPVCAAEVPTASGDPGNPAWSRCWNCETQFQSPRTTGTRFTVAMSPLPRGRSAVTPETQLEVMLAHFEPYRRAGRLLDVGFGEGQLLVAAAAEGWQCWGTETSRAALDSGRRRGWRVLSGDLCRIGLPESLFDVICMAHVLEYLEQPAAYLREAIRLLRPGGLLYLATTSVHAVETQPPACQQSYLQLFTASAVRLALETAGYTRERIAISSAATRQDPAPPPRLLRAVVQQLLRANPMGERLTAFAERPR